MKTSSHKDRIPRIVALLALGVLAHLVPVPARADVLNRFTGYTRPGTPGEGVANATRPVAAEERQGIGATVYFTVLDRSDGTRGDSWGTGIKNFDSRFVPGRDMAGRSLDGTSRYLYLYQVINDSGRDAALKTTTIRLLVPPELITSWGYFSERTGKGVMGVGFSMAFPGEKGNVIRPVSTAHPGVDTNRYNNPAPHHPAPRPYGFTNITVGAEVPVAAGEDHGRVPEAVLLLPMATWENAPERVRPFPPLTAFWPGFGRTTYDLEPGGVAPVAYGSGRSTAPALSPFAGAFGAGMRLYAPSTVTYRSGMTGPVSYSSVTPVTWGGGVGTAAGRAEALYRSPAVRAYWSDDPLKPRERSVLFGFTSNFPPVFDDARIRGLPVGAIRPAAGQPDKGGKGVKPAVAPEKDGKGIKPASGQPDKKDGKPAPAPKKGGEALHPLLISLSLAQAADPEPAQPAAAVGGGVQPAVQGSYGEVPTPIAAAAAEQSAGGAAAGGGGGVSGGGGLGGFPGGGGGFPGGGLGGGGVGGFPGGVGGFPGGGGNNGGGGNQAQTPTTQNPNQTTTPPGNGPLINSPTVNVPPGTTTPGQTPNVQVNVNQNQNQSQAQAQAQAQAQNQSQTQTTPPGGGEGNVVPAPPALVLALVGLPFLLVLRRRKGEAV